MLIDDAGDDTYQSRFFGQGCKVKCGVGKGLAMAVRGGVGILVNTTVELVLSL